MARELVRADGRKREGQEEWTIKRWMPSPSNPRVQIQVLERYGLGGSVVKQEVLAEAKVEPMTPARPPAPKQNGVMQMLPASPVKVPPPQIYSTTPEMIEVRGARQGMKTKRRFRKKSHVFIFPNEGEWNAWLRKKDLPSSVAGYAYKDELLVGAQGEKDDYAKVVCHEAAHAVVARYYAGRRWPLWLNEGFAEYMGSKALAVKRSHQVQRYLSTGADSPIDISQVTDRLTYGVSGGLIPSDSPLRKFYPNSEKMVRVLQERLPAAAFPKFVNLLVAGNPFEVSLREAYGKSCADAATFKGLLDSTK